jgi:branched-chain amino acid transport system permease protein
MSDTETTTPLAGVRRSWRGLSRRARWGVYGAVVLALATVPLLTDNQFLLNTFIFVFLFAALGHGWNVIGGYTGQISLGHAIMFAAGAYGTTILFVYYGVTPLVGIWIGGFVAVAVGLVLGAATFRLRYHYFAMATLAAALIARVVFFRWDFVGGATGIEYPFAELGTLYSFTFREKAPYFYIIGGFTGLVTLLVYRLDRSKLGVYLKAINMDETAAKNAGIDTFQYKMYAMAISSFITGLAGGLYAQYVLYIDPMSTLRLLRNIDIIMVAIIGGVGTVAGPLVGAGVFIPVREYTRTTLSGEATGAGWVIFGVVLLLISLYRPGGILNQYSGRWGGE